MPIEIYCDGSGDNNGTRKGSFGVVVLDNNSIIHVYRETEENTTNNIMELKALIYALRFGKQYTDCIVYTDSAYVCKAFNDWIPNIWSKNGWIDSKGKQVKNLELMKELYYDKRNFCLPTVKKVKGHSTSPGNNLADRIAAGDKRGIEKIIKTNGLEINLIV